ncbi:MAG: RraA family protein [Megasphaera sp.]|uniref:RraA family protein n=1 Tax=unclassified Megasphaera TaxID=2626256 RepID=UPI003A80499F
MVFDYKKWQSVSTTAVADVMETPLMLPAALRPLNMASRIVGQAFTVQLQWNHVGFLWKAIASAKAGDILVITGCRDRLAYMGDIMAGTAQSQGIQGVIMNGYIRDSHSICQSRFPVFSLGYTPKAAPIGKSIGMMNVPIMLGQVPIAPGDILVADNDGILSIPRTIADEVLTKAAHKEDADTKRKLLLQDENWLMNFLKEKMR